MRIVLIVVLVSAAFLAGCGGDGGGDGGKPKVVVTTVQLGDVVRQVAGDRVELETLLDAKADPHDYEPRPSDARAVAEADLVLRSGGEVDDWLGDVVESAGGDADVIVVGEEIRARGDDPHWWQDPLMTFRAIGIVWEALRDADPQGDETYRRGTAAFGREVSLLHRAIATCMRSIPRERRKLVTSHDAFGYFARRYGIEILGSIIPGRSTSAQPSARDARELVAAIRREGVRTVFPESALDPRLEEAVARDAGARVGEALYADTLGPSGSYVEALRHDAAAMARGFGGDCDL